MQIVKALGVGAGDKVLESVVISGMPSHSIWKRKGTVRTGIIQIPIHLQKCYSDLDIHQENLPIAGMTTVRLYL